MKNNKPISMIIKETRESLINIINNSQLHPSILYVILKDIYLDVNRLNIATEISEMEQYLQEQKEQELKESTAE